MRHRATISQDPILASRRMLLLPVLQPWEGCDLPSWHSLISSFPHGANSCTTHYLRESGDPKFLRTSRVFSPARSVRTEMRAECFRGVPSRPWQPTPLASTFFAG